MPNYPHLIEDQVDFDGIVDRVAAMATLGVPYTDEEIASAADDARAQAAAIVAEIIEQEGPGAIPEGVESTSMIALVAYLQRLGTDLNATEATEVEDSAEEPDS